MVEHRFLAVFGGTEITVPDLLGDGSLAHQERLAPAPAFFQGQWNDLVTDPLLLGTPTYVLRYDPLREGGASSPP